MKPRQFPWRRMVVLGVAAWAAGVMLAQAQMAETLSSGVGEDERKAQAGYSVRFEFAQAAGPYLANVQVVVYDASRQKVVETVSEGPWLFADLSPGQYSVVATARSGERQGARFTVNGSGQKVVRLAWR